MKTLSCVIIDDETLARAVVRKYLSGIEGVEILGEAENGFEGAQLIQKLKPDFIFLDVEMPKLTGMEMMQVLEEPPMVIFTTAYMEHAVKAFEMNAIDYLLKPFSKDRLSQSISKIRKQLENDQEDSKTRISAFVNATTLHLPIQRVAVKNVHAIKVIPVEEIRYIETQDDYVMIYTKEGKYLKQQAMKQLESQLDPKTFARIHRSFLLNIHEIHKIEPGEKLSYWMILKDNTRLPISRSGYSLLKETLGF